MGGKNLTTSRLLRGQFNGLITGATFMSNSQKSSNLKNTKEPSMQKLTEEESNRLALFNHLKGLVKDSPQEAKGALVASLERLPEMHLIAQNQPQSQWAAAVMNSDSMHSLL